jgi:hypothetical protein
VCFLVADVGIKLSPLWERQQKAGIKHKWKIYFCNKSEIFHYFCDTRPSILATGTRLE